MIEQQEIYYAYTGNGVTTQYAYGCRIFTAADLVVTVAGIVKALGVDYTITGVDDIGGGEITFVPAAVPANGVTVELERVLSYKRGTSYVQNGGFQPEIVDKDQDYQTAILQQMEFVLRRVLLFPSDAAAEDLVLPLLAARKSKLIGFDVNGKLAVFDASYTVVVSAGAGSAPTVTYADATAGPVNVNLPASGEVIVIKSDATANPVTVTATGGKTILRQAAIDLTVQDESIRICMNGTNWFRI